MRASLLSSTTSCFCFDSFGLSPHPSFLFELREVESQVKFKSRSHVRDALRRAFSFSCRLYRPRSASLLRVLIGEFVDFSDELFFDVIDVSIFRVYGIRDFFNVGDHFDVLTEVGKFNGCIAAVFAV